MKVFWSRFQKQIRWQRPAHRFWNRLFLVMAFFLLYGVLFIPIYSFWGKDIEITLLSVIPVGITGWFFGPLIGLFAGVLITAFNGFLLNIAGVFKFQWGFMTWMAIDLVTCGLVGILAGRWNDHRYLNQSRLIAGKESNPDQQGWMVYHPGDFEATLASIVASIPGAILVTDRHGNMIHWNKAMETLTGIPAGQILGKNSLEVAKLIFKEERTLPVDYLLGLSAEPEKEYPGFKREGQSFLMESFFPGFRQGGAYLNLCTSPLFNLDGILVGALLVLQDVTENRISQERQSIREQRDITTGLFSLEYFEKEIARIEYKKNFPNSIILVRVKKNPEQDRKGHEKGKEENSIRKFAVLLQTFFRVSDTVTYLGEGDFAVLIPRANPGLAQSLAERLRKSLAMQNSGPGEIPVCSVVSVTALEAGTLKDTIQQGRQLLSGI